MDLTEKLKLGKYKGSGSQFGYGGEQLVLQVVDLLTVCTRTAQYDWASSRFLVGWQPKEG